MVKYWALPYSRLPAILSGASITCFTLAILMWLLNNAFYPVLLFYLGILFSLLSVGRNVEIRDNSIVLWYGYPKAVIRYVVRDVVSVFDVNELERGSLVRYFKYHLFVFSLIIVLPLMYLSAKGLYPNPAYLPLIFLPVFIGIILQLYIMLTSRSYRRMMRWMGWILASVWTTVGFVVGIVYRETYGESLFSNLNATILYFTGMLLLAISSVILLALIGRHHVIIVETADKEFYAIGTLSARDAKELIRKILEEVVKNAEATA